MQSISILIITYNQQDVISRALDSIIIQANHGLNEIIVCDDCSTDNSWDVISEYQYRYPSIIKAYRNQQNLGIYLNIEKVISLRGSSNLYMILAGDDALEDGTLLRLQEYINSEKVDTNESVALYFDWKVIRPNGVSFKSSNRKVLKNPQQLTRLIMRTYVYNRGTFISEKLISQFSPVPKYLGVSLAEYCFEMQYGQYADVVHYCPCVADVYYSQIGFSTKMKTDRYKKEEIAKWNYFIENNNLCQKDIAYAKMRICSVMFSQCKSFKVFCDLLKYRIKSYDHDLGYDWRQDYFLLRGILRSIMK